MSENITDYNAQPSKGKTITTNKITGAMITSDKIQSRLPGQTPEPPKSSLAITAVVLLLLGFGLIVLGLFIMSVLIPLSILGGAIILSANVVGILSLREMN